jgi:hypothetical protein
MPTGDRKHQSSRGQKSRGDEEKEPAQGFSLFTSFGKRVVRGGKTYLESSEDVVVRKTNNAEPIRTEPTHRKRRSTRRPRSSSQSHRTGDDTEEDPVESPVCSPTGSDEDRDVALLKKSSKPKKDRKHSNEVVELGGEKAASRALSKTTTSQSERRKKAPEPQRGSTISQAQSNAITTSPPKRHRKSPSRTGDGVKERSKPDSSSHRKRSGSSASSSASTIVPGDSVSQIVVSESESEREDDVPSAQNQASTAKISKHGSSATRKPNPEALDAKSTDGKRPIEQLPEKSKTRSHASTTKASNTGDKARGAEPSDRRSVAGQSQTRHSRTSTTKASITGDKAHGAEPSDKRSVAGQSQTRQSRASTTKASKTGSKVNVAEPSDKIPKSQAGSSIHSDADDLDTESGDSDAESSSDESVASQATMTASHVSKASKQLSAHTASKPASDVSASTKASKTRTKVDDAGVSDEKSLTGRSQTKSSRRSHVSRDPKPPIADEATKPASDVSNTKRSSVHGAASHVSKSSKASSAHRSATEAATSEAATTASARKSGVSMPNETQFVFRPAAPIPPPASRHGESDASTAPSTNGPQRRRRRRGDES